MVGSKAIYMKKYLLFTVFSACLLFVQAQKQDKPNPVGPSKIQSYSFTLAAGGGSFTTALGYQHLWQVGKKKKLGLGIGARFTSAFGSNQYFTTAPAKLTSGKTGPGVLFSEDIEQNIDSVLFNRHQINSLNLSLHLHYRFAPKWGAGFNIDALGFSFGGEQRGQYLGNNGIGAATTGKPTGFNVLLISDNDKGSLNSEIFVDYALSKKWRAKLGYQYLFMEYTTRTEVQTTPDGQKNDRFRNKASGISLGLTYNF